MRNTTPVNVLRPEMSAPEVTILKVGAGFTASFKGEVIATSGSSLRLAEWAFTCGALVVHHDYDLRLAR